ncbi:PspA/IM30 family protein [Tropicimonas sp. TH_r6]|uniref:PspA/IM30 family protein n=1 Tax=Tropicimonas sp. TH_r6 TaxID=3082085 RepID=UPI0029540D28|nr:PspA/IM30 family protein [Tropicimonas sp. TH_r6]MDV7142665.1 PspA/IM30 family protein [Tropicimonas sp. TH_r6]
MFATLKTLFAGTNARTEETLQDQFAIELIDQKIREADANLAAAKGTLATLIQRQRQEKKLFDALETRIADLTARARAALAEKREDLAGEAATAIAEMENEHILRLQTLERLEARILQLQGSVEAAHRRIVDLKQGAITARAIRREQDIQKRMSRTVGGTSAADEAEKLIRRVSEQDDPFEQSQILKDIDDGLSQANIAEKMSDAGFGPTLKSTRKSVLDRLNAEL